MRKRPPTVRACSLRARKLAKEGEGDSKKGKALAACAATPRRSRPRPKVAPATKKTCRRRAKALQSGKVGRSDRSKVAYRLTLCRKRKPSAKGVHRANPQGFLKITAKQFDGYNRARHGSMSLVDDDFNMKHFGITRAQFRALGQIHARVAGMIGQFTLRGVNRWLEEAHPRDVGFVKEAFPAAGAHRCNPSAPTVKAKVVASKTAGKVYRRRFLLVQLGLSRGVARVNDRPHRQPRERGCHRDRHRRPGLPALGGAPHGHRRGLQRLRRAARDGVVSVWPRAAPRDG